MMNDTSVCQERCRYAKRRLEYFRVRIRENNVSGEEIDEFREVAPWIEPDDSELCAAADRLLAPGEGDEDRREHEKRVALNRSGYMNSLKGGAQ